MSDEKQLIEPIDTPATRVRAALEACLEVNDTNEGGRPYCSHCGATKGRMGKYRHDGECVVTVAVEAAKEKRRARK